MATYQKRGYKKTVENEKEIVVDDQGNVENSTTAEVFNTLDETANKSEKWIEKNSKPLFITLLLIVVAIFGYMAYTQFVVEPKEKKAANALVFAKTEFTAASNSNEATSYENALNGAEGHFGLLDIAEQYGNTNAGNLAKYYAGIAYLNTKEYSKAIDFLSDVTTKDATLNTVIKGSIGDAYLAQDNTSEALSSYSKAANTTDNLAVTPIYLLKAGKLALSLQEYEKAQTFFTTIKEQYPNSSQANNIALYINQAKYAQ